MSGSPRGHGGKSEKTASIGIFHADKAILDNLKGEKTYGEIIKEILSGKEIRLNEEDKTQLDKLAGQWKINNGDLAGFMVQCFAEVGKRPREFMAFLKNNAKRVGTDAPILEMPEDACLGLVTLTATFATKEDETNYHCVRGSKRGTVKIKKIGKFKEQVENVCISCISRVNLEDRWEEILAKDQYGLEEHTYCSKGEEIDIETGKIKCGMQAQSLGGTWFDQDVCFTIDEGRKCPMLRTLPAKAVKKTGIKRRYRK